MAEMRNFEAEAEEAVLGRIPASTPGTPQEGHMTSISNAKAAIDQAAQQLAVIGSNHLAEAIADAGIGTTLTPGDISLVLAVIRAIEHGPGLTAVTAAQDAQQAV